MQIISSWEDKLNELYNLLGLGVIVGDSVGNKVGDQVGVQVLEEEGTMSVSSSVS